LAYGLIWLNNPLDIKRLSIFHQMHKIRGLKLVHPKLCIYRFLDNWFLNTEKVVQT